MARLVGIRPLYFGIGADLGSAARGPGRDSSPDGSPLRPGSCVCQRSPVRRSTMSNAQIRREPASESPAVREVETKLEVIVLPVSDVDRAKRFYAGLGWRLDADFASGPEFRVVQLTPPGSP